MKQYDYWHGKEPFVTLVVGPWPWREHGSMSVNPIQFLHRCLFIREPCAALMKEGPKSIVKVTS